MNSTIKNRPDTGAEKPRGTAPNREALPETLSPDLRIDLEVPGMRLYYLAMTHLLDNLHPTNDEEPKCQ